MSTNIKLIMPTVQPMFFLSFEDFDMLKTFVELARPQVIPKESNVFLSYRGNSQTGGDISGRLNTLLKKSGVREDEELPKNWSVNIIRKLASTLVREDYSAREVQAVCDTMCHSEATSKEHYWTRRREKSVATGTETLKSIFFVSLFLQYVPINFGFLMSN